MYARCMFVIAAILVSNEAGFAQSVGGAVAYAITCGQRSRPLPLTFTASWKVTSVKKRSEGLVITNVRTVRAANDSVGRVFNETHSTVWNGGKPAGPGTMIASVGDPLRHVTITWNSGSREAVIFHAPRQSQEQAETAKNLIEPEPECPQTPATLSPPSESAVEHLGPKMIHGMEATGKRFRTVQPDADGNGKWTPVIQESWNWTDYGVEVLRVVRYPNGEYEKSELLRYEKGAPDPALFEVPEGYTARDVYQEAPPH